MAALLSGVHTGIAGTNGGRDDAEFLEFAEIEKVERCDAGRDAIRRHAGEETPRESEPHEIQFLHDLECESCVRARIEREGREIMAVIVSDLGDAIAHIAGDDLAFAENLARHRIERVIVHADERAAQQIDAVENQAARNARLTAAEIAVGFADANRAGIPAERRKDGARAPRCAQYREIEIDDVPARQHVRIEAPNALAKCIQRREFIDAASRVIRHRAIAAVHDEHLIDAAGIH